MQRAGSGWTRRGRCGTAGGASARPAQSKKSPGGQGPDGAAMLAPGACRAGRCPADAGRVVGASWARGGCVGGAWRVMGACGALAAAWPTSDGLGPAAGPIARQRSARRRGAHEIGRRGASRHRSAKTPGSLCDGADAIGVAQCCAMAANRAAIVRHRHWSAAAGGSDCPSRAKDDLPKPWQR